MSKTTLNRYFLFSISCILFSIILASCGPSKKVITEDPIVKNDTINVVTTPPITTPKDSIPSTTTPPKDTIPDKEVPESPKPSIDTIPDEQPPNPAPKPKDIQLVLQVNNTVSTNDDYITWSPIPCQIQISNSTEITEDIRIQLSNKNEQGGQIIFSKTLENFSQSDELDLSLNQDGSPTTFYIAGKFGHPSSKDKDAVILVQHQAVDSIIMEHALMVRIRKNANQLSPEEIQRFLAALSKLHLEDNNYQVYIDLHQENTKQIGHTGPGFLPWHRCLLLDLERELQAIDPSVTIPYWRFDQPSKNIFTKEFMGAQNIPNSFLLEFADDNPLNQWNIQGVAGIERDTSRLTFNSQWIYSEEETIGLGASYFFFRRMEDNPHGNAHILFNGFLNNIGTAVKDPMFFILHANADRLWAKWQWQWDKYDATDESCFAPQGSYSSNNQFRIGHFVEDTMWPWNGKTGMGSNFNFGDYPTTAPGGPLPDAPSYEDKPGPMPHVKDMIDYRGSLQVTNSMNFDYDDIPYFNDKND